MNEQDGERTRHVHGSAYWNWFYSHQRSDDGIAESPLANPDYVPADLLPVEHEKTELESFIGRLVNDPAERVRIFTRKEDKVFEQVFVLGESTREAARTLGISQTRVVQIAKRIRKKLFEQCVQMEGFRPYK